MRRALLLIVGFGAGGLLLLALGISVAAQYTVPKEFLHILPVEIEGTFLRALELSVYEGPFWEDGTGEEVVDVVGLVVENYGGCLVSEGAVVLDWGEDQMVFEFSWLPPGQKVLVLEKKRKSFFLPVDMRCYGWSTEVYPVNTGEVTVEETGSKEISFINRSSAIISNATAMFKHYDAQSDMYIGGITYSVAAEQLQPGEIRSITPWRYAAGYSRIVSILTGYE